MTFSLTLDKACNLLRDTVCKESNFRGFKLRHALMHGIAHMPQESNLQVLTIGNILLM